MNRAFLAIVALAFLSPIPGIAQVASSAPSVALDPRLAKWGALGKMVGKKFGHPAAPTEWFLPKDNMIVSRFAAGVVLQHAYIYKGPGKAEYAQLNGSKLGTRSKVTFDDNSWTIRSSGRNQRFWLTPEGHVWKDVYGDLDAEKWAGHVQSRR